MTQKVTKGEIEVPFQGGLLIYDIHTCPHVQNIREITELDELKVWP
jgi:hypothetical protein